MKTIHIVFNAHIDPIWLWPWPSGLDTVLATCRSACDRLDAHGDITFCRGEAWVYQMIERIDPPLFARIRAHVAGGRWAVVGGWWIQPDCNLPSGWGLRRQIALGRRYFIDRFGAFPQVAFNVDSFGHAASLPDLMHEAGQSFYVMMRPQEHERSLPARLFRWHGRADGPSVLVFRIARSYCTGVAVTLEHLEAALTELPDRIDHTMCFVGVGDHGGGPTERQIAWLREHRDAIPGAQLVFSTPRRFFDAVAGQADRLPTVVGELQMHAIGCYSVDRPTKVRLRRAEHLLAQAEQAVRMDPAPSADAAARLDGAWKTACFHQFHDTLGGTCIPSAYDHVHAELGGAAAEAETMVHMSLRRRMNALPDDRRQRIVLCNASDRPYAGYHICEPWLGWEPWQPHWRLLDEQDAIVPTQVLRQEAVTARITRLLFRVGLEPGDMTALRIDTGGGPVPVSPATSAAAHRLSSPTGAAARFAPQPCLILPHADGSGAPLEVAMPHLALLDDPTDTWSHGVDRYDPRPGAAPAWSAPVVEDGGPLMASLVQCGDLGRSRVAAEWRVYAAEPFVELVLRVEWCEQRRLLKLVLRLPAPLVSRYDGIPGDALARASDGCERPLRDRTRLLLDDGRSLGVVCPDVFALDADSRRVRFTLLRAAVMAHHDPHPGVAPPTRSSFSDRGEHTFRFRFFGPGVTGTMLDDHAMMLQRPLVSADLTRGMRAWPDAEGAEQ